MTSKSNLPFNQFSSNIYSQNGEDGIIAEICRQLGITHENCWCVEFGAWDGKHLSNTFHLVENGWNAIYIEGEEERFLDLLSTSKYFQKITPVLAFVEAERESNNSLNNILEKTLTPTDFDLLSIDVDSIDLDIWESLDTYAPKVVIIEINSSVPPGVLWRHTKKTQGNTFSATLNVANEKGYTLVCHTGNMIFIRDDLIEKINIKDRYLKYPELLFITDWIRN